MAPPDPAPPTSPPPPGRGMLVLYVTVILSLMGGVIWQLVPHPPPLREAAREVQTALKGRSATPERVEVVQPFVDCHPGVREAFLDPNGAGPTPLPPPWEEEMVEARFFPPPGTPPAADPPRPDAPPFLLAGRCRGNALEVGLFARGGAAPFHRLEVELLPPPRPGQTLLHLTSRPSGAVVRQGDGGELGTTPLLQAVGADAPLEIRLSAPGHSPARITLPLRGGEVTRHQVALTPGKGTLLVTSHPSRLRLSLDGTPVAGRTPLALEGVAAGAHTLELEDGSGRKQTQPVQVRAGGATPVQVRLPGTPAPQRPPWPDPLTGSTFVWVAPGCFEMGCGFWNSDCDPDEKPAHWVCVDGFWIGKHEVTQGVWQRVMGENPSRFPAGDDHPVDRVSWEAAREFITRLNGQGRERFRLPTEAEWEYACRSGGKEEKFAGVTDRQARTTGNGAVRAAAWLAGPWQGSHPVGEKAPNGLGLHDMSGNVWEWTADAFIADSYAGHGTKNPLVEPPATPWPRVVRGGSWFTYFLQIRCGYRQRFNAGHANPDVGLRLVREERTGG